jgi:hypothetical protein
MIIKFIKKLLLRGNRRKTAKGLGDFVKNITDNLGIQQCDSCKARQKWLNEHFPYDKK